MWTNGSRFHPGVKKRANLVLSAGRGLTAGAGGPSPADQMIGRDMVHDIFEGSAAIARGILDLRADLPNRLAFPAHITRR